MNAPQKPLPFPVVNGMVAIEHVRYLMDDRRKLIAALQSMCGAHGNDEQWWEGEGETRYQNQIDNERLPYPTGDVIRAQVTEDARVLLREMDAAPRARINVALGFNGLDAAAAVEAYPRLVEALRTLTNVDYTFLDNKAIAGPMQHQVNEARALLKELGEDA